MLVRCQFALQKNSWVFQKVTKKKNRKGATKRRQPFPVKKVIVTAGKSLIGLVAIGLTAVSMQFIFGLDIRLMNVKDIEIETPLVYQDETQLMNVLNSRKDQSFLLLNTIELAEELELLPWIRKAAVQKRWPATLVLTVSEHEPVAVWNQSAVLNGEGMPLERPVADMSLAELSGPEGAPETVMSHYLQFGQIFQEFGFRIAAVDLKARGAWSLTLHKGIEISLGQKEVLERSRRVVKVLRSDNFDIDNIETIDARYPNGAAVKLKQETAEVEHDIAA